MIELSSELVSLNFEDKTREMARRRSILDYASSFMKVFSSS